MNASVSIMPTTESENRIFALLICYLFLVQERRIFFGIQESEGEGGRCRLLVDVSLQFITGKGCHGQLISFFINLFIYLIFIYLCFKLFCYCNRRQQKKTSLIHIKPLNIEHCSKFSWNGSLFVPDFSHWTVFTLYLLCKLYSLRL